MKQYQAVLAGTGDGMPASIGAGPVRAPGPAVLPPQSAASDIDIDIDIQDEGDPSLLAQLPGQVALVGIDGAIVAVNAGWRRFAAANGLADGRCAGFNYMAVCAAARGDGEDDAHVVLEGLRDILRGSLDEFEHEYPCHAPDQQRWFRLRATALRWQGARAVLMMHADITGEILARRAYTQGRAVLRMAGASIGTWRYDRQARGFVVSPEVARTIELPPGVALRSAQVLRSVGSHHRALLLGAFRGALQTGRRFEVEAQFQTRRRSPPVWLRIGGEAAAGEGLQGALQVIGDRKRLEEALAEKARTLALLACCHDVLVRASDESRLLDDLCAAIVASGSHPAAWIAGLDPLQDALRPRAGAGLPEGLLTPDFLAWRAGAVRAALRRGRLQVVPSVRASTRYARWAAAHVARGIQGLVAVPLVDGERVHGALVLYLGHEGALSERELESLAALGRDIGYGIGALRARAERAATLRVMALQSAELAHSRELLVAAQAVARLGSVEVNHPSAVIACTPGTQAILGLAGPPRSLPELVQALSPASRDEFLRLLQPARPAPPFDIELEVRDGPAASRWVRAVCAPSTTARGNRACSTVVFQDVTRIRRAHDEVLQLNADLERRVARRTRQAATANRELEAFSYSVSHDLKAPLAAIDGFSHVLAGLLKGRLDERETHYLDRVRAGVASMYDLIDAMLTLHGASHGPELEWRVVDLSAIAQDLVDGLREQEPGRACSIRIQPGIHARCDQALITQVLRNLIGNAWKFSARKPLIVIDIGAEPGTVAGVTIRITDQGAGFDPAQARNLFTPFKRLHHASEFPGTGVGLATVQRIMRRHGGAVRAQGREGHGATFWIDLPAGTGPRPDSSTAD